MHGLLLLALLLVACVPHIRSTPGLKSSVTITRDQHGIPHIRAQNDLDVFFAQGYAHAQDRLWQMELARRTAAGRLAEILGPSALEQDKFLRTWGFYRAAQAQLPYLSEFSRQALEAYAAGVNAFIAEGNLPWEFAIVGAKPEPWTPADSLGWGKVIAYELANTWQDEVVNSRLVEKIGLDGLNELLPPYPSDAPTILQPEDYPARQQGRFPALPGLSAETRGALERVVSLADSLSGLGFDAAQGSNNWVISGSRTTTGKPLLANDPHLRFQNPALWYLIDLRGPGYNSLGASIPGIPGVVLGRNDFVAWGATNAKPDTMDLFILEVQEGGYITPGHWVPLTRRSEVIKVKGEAEVQLEVRESEYGPLISDLGNLGSLARDGQAVAVAWTGLDPADTTLDAWLGINRARSGAEFREALRRFVVPMQNFVYADVAGEIGYIAPGRVPRRDWDGRLPASAAEGQRWKGFIPLEELPQVVNPKEGFIVSANNRILPPGGPDLSTYVTEVYRAARIRGLILAQPKLSPEDMAAIQGDTTSLVAREIRPLLLALEPQSTAARRLQDTVKAWDLRAELDSTGATAFAFFWREVSRMLDDETGLSSPNAPLIFVRALKTNGRWCDDQRTPVQETCSDFLAQALEKGAAELERRLGPDPRQWQWGRIHKARFNAVLGAVPLVGGWFNREISTPGSFQTVNVASYNPDTFIQTSGPSLRTIFDLSNLNQSRAIYPLGQSGNLWDGHYASFLEPWRDNQTVLLSTRPQDWGTTHTLVLRP